MSQQAKVIDVSRHRMGTDGHGIVTLIVLAGCPLSCKYCINDFCHISEGEIITVDELLEFISLDDIYFKMSGGGITFGGGEPLLQSDFIKCVAEKMDSKWKLNIETSLYVPWKKIEPIIDVVDKWYVDVKDLSDTIYRDYTGKSVTLLRKNLDRLYDAVDHDKIVLRVPDIPNYNTEMNIENTLRYLSKYDSEIDRFIYEIKK